MANVPISKMQVPGSNDVLLLRDDSAANLVTGATNGNLAGLDANGNLTDSGVSASSIGNLSGSHTGTCETAAATSAKIVTIGDGTWIPKEGDIIGVKFTYSNTALFVTLNVNGIGNKSIWYGDSVDPSGADYICGKADSYIFYMYDGTYWIWLNEGQHDGNNFPSVAVYTQSNQQIKIGTCNYYTLTNKSYCHFIFRYANSYKGELFIKINNSSSKTIYINGEISSSTNYTLPAGTYIAYYENDKWYFRTDGKLTANITGTAASDSTKADKVTSATSGNLAGLNASGNLTDSGVAASEIPALWKSQGEYGVKNLIPYPWRETTKTLNGVIFTCNNGDSITISTASGGATANAALFLRSYVQGLDEILIKKGETYIIGGISGGSTTTYQLYIATFLDAVQKEIWFTIDGDLSFTPTQDFNGLNIYVRVVNGAVITNPIIIKPMLRLASDTDDTYRPYAKTNKQLTDEVGKNIEDIDTLENRASTDTTSASGNPISITGLKSNQLAVNPVITFEPIQAGSGDPSPSNVRAISGYDKIEVLSCGKNLFNGKVIQGKWSTINGTWIAQSDFWATQNPIPIIGGQSNYISSTIYRVYYDKNMTFISVDDTGSAVATTPANAVWMHMTQSKTDWSSPSITMVAISNTAVDYVPYHKTTDLSENLPQTVYGGTLDVRTGKFTIDKVKGIITSSATTSWASSYNGAFVTANVPYSIKAYGFNDTPNWICDKFKAYSRGGLQNATQGIAEYTDSSLKYLVKVSGVSNITDFNTWLFNNAPIEVVMELATPIEIQLTPHEISLLKDYAYVSTNGTSISLDYHNGEIATLGDVAQLGETVNELGGCLNDLVIRVTKVFSNTGSVAAGAYKSMVENVADIIPNGYKGVVAIPAYTGDDNFAWVSCFYSPSNNNLSIGIRNVTTTADSGAPQVLLLCIRV